MQGIYLTWPSSLMILQEENVEPEASNTGFATVTFVTDPGMEIYGEVRYIG